MRKSAVSGLATTLAFCVACSGAMASAEAIEALPTAGQVLERYIEAVGGRDSAESQTTRVSLGRMIHDIHWRKPPYEVVPVAGYATSTGNALMVEHESGGLRCEGFDGETTWIQDTGGVRPNDNPFGSKTAWLLDPQGVLRLEEYFPDLEVTARESIDGRPVHVLEPKALERAHYALYFDAETGLLIRIGYYWELKDYRDVDGIRIPFRVDMSRKGGSTTLILDSVVHNLPLDAQLFAVPEEKDTSAD